MQAWRTGWVVIVASLLAATVSFAQQGEQAAVLLVNANAVEFRRAGTDAWLPVREAVLGSGDALRTDTTGKATIVFFEDGTEIDMLPNTTLHIDSFTADDDNFTLRVTLVVGQTVHRLKRAFSSKSVYEVKTQSGLLAARGTEFAARQRENTQLSFLAFESAVVVGYGNDSAVVSEGFGGRAEPDGTLSDIVRASSFVELDALLDGCAATVTPQANRLLPVFLGPDETSPGIGTVNPYNITWLTGTTDDRAWYRVPYQDGAGWITTAINVSQVRVDGCAGLRVYPDDRRETLSTKASSSATAGLRWGYCTGERQPPANWQPYTIKPTQTLYELAQRFNSTEQRLAEINCIADIRSITAGQTIYVPTP
jgi:hypothetical protein